MAADAAVSAGVVVAGLDPVVSLGIAALILVSTWGLLRDSVNLALDRGRPNVRDVSRKVAEAAVPG